MHARVFVTLKKEVLDPQGDAVHRALESLGFEQVESVRVGKLIDIELEEQSNDRAQGVLRAMCDRLLTNPVIEDATFEIKA